MPVAGTPDSLYRGRIFSCVPDVREAIMVAQKNNFDFVAVPLAHPRLFRSAKHVQRAEEPFTRSDMVLENRTWTSSVVGLISDWIDCDASAAALRKDAAKVLEQELDWALHLNCYSILLPTPKSMEATNYMNAVHRWVIQRTVVSQLWMKIPLMVASEGPEGTEFTDGWQIWNRCRLLMEHPANVAVAVEFSEDLPSEEALKRWLSEPVKAVILPMAVFRLNEKGFPVFKSKAHTAFLMSLFKYKVQVLFDFGASDDRYEIDHYVTYLTRLFQKKPPLTQAENFALPYLDYLQAPLQPLQDNLESQTYDTFEQDPVKYVQYEEAVYECLKDKMAASPGRTEFVVMVVGAGRGPLVVASRNAGNRAGAKCQFYAVEKNPNAVVTLRHRKRTENWVDVTIVAHDMRDWAAPVMADVMVSELLGSFGDNELSPECLDGAQAFLAKDGVSIPCEYYSTLQPVSTPKLWNDIANYDDREHYETPYVVMFHRAYYPAETKPVFSFSHPSTTENDRETTVSWELKEDALIHGFAGYFHCDLYKKIHISIEPSTFSTGMFSWFPIYFPIRQPKLFKKGEQLTMQMWRNSSAQKVWYEWAIIEPRPTCIHNVNGRSYAIGK